jgi:hypothetical protein
VAAREEYRCAITKDFDFGRAMELTARGMEVPPSAQRRMQAAHIIPLSLDKFNEDKGPVSRIFFRISNSHILKKKDVAYTWDMLQAWTGLDPDQLAGSNINSAENCIFMNDLDHIRFGGFFFYFDKDEVGEFLGCCRQANDLFLAHRFPQQVQSTDGPNGPVSQWTCNCRCRVSGERRGSIP